VICAYGTAEAHRNSADILEPVRALHLSDQTKQLKTQTRLVAPRSGYASSIFLLYGPVTKVALAVIRSAYGEFTDQSVRQSDRCDPNIAT
jgi:hypothetical protein